MNRTKLFSMALFLATLCFSLQGTEGSNVDVGSRRLSEQEVQQIQERRAEEASSEEELNENAKSIAKYCHPHAIHFCVARTQEGDLLEIEDGSQWRVKLSEIYKVQQWISSDPLTIQPNNAWFSNFGYKIINQVTGTSVQVNLSAGPLYASSYRHWVVDIDDFNGIVWLENGTSWHFSAGDSAVVGRWDINDTVIVGSNRGLSSWSYPCILINVDLNEYIVVKDNY